MANIMMVDFDGPLLPSKHGLFKHVFKGDYRGLGGNQAKFDDWCVRAHNIIRRYGECKVVFSTNWALHKRPHQLKAICESNGLDFGDHYHDDCITPKRFTSHRGREILGWIVDNAQDGDKILILDDMEYECNHIEENVANLPKAKYLSTEEYERFKNMENPPIAKFINVDMVEGFSYQNLKDSMEFLGITWDEVNFGEFDIPIKTEEEKKKDKEMMEFWLRAMI